VRLTDIEVVADESGQVSLELSGRAAELADQAGAGEIALSLSHEGGLAAATVVIA
jgi:holo-[acyl-carrier protein] synthase